MGLVSCRVTGPSLQPARCDRAEMGPLPRPLGPSQVPSKIPALSPLGRRQSQSLRRPRWKRTGPEGALPPQSRVQGRSQETRRQLPGARLSSPAPEPPGASTRANPFLVPQARARLSPSPAGWSLVPGCSGVSAACSRGGPGQAGAQPPAHQAEGQPSRPYTAIPPASPALPPPTATAHSSNLSSWPSTRPLRSRTLHWLPTTLEIKPEPCSRPRRPRGPGLCPPC